MPVRREKPEVLAGYVKREIEEMILSGEIHPGDCLDPELVLAEKMGVSRVTLREALRLLENEGTVVKKNGVGTFVAIPQHFLSGRLEVDFSLSDSASAAGLSLRTEVASREERVATEREARNLGLKTGETVFCIQRLRYFQKHCVVMSFDVVPMAAFRSANPKELEWSSVYSTLETESNSRIVMGEATLSATFAKQEYARIMQVDIGSPLMLIEQVDFIQVGKPVLFSREYYNTNIFRFRINRQRDLEQHSLEYFSKEME